MLIGETGAGKTSLIRHLAHLTNNAFQRFNLSGQTEKMDFIGGYYPDDGGRFVWRNGALITAMKNGEWLCIDEINLAPSQVVERINSLLDDDGFLVVTEHAGEKYMRKVSYDKKLEEYARRISAIEGLTYDEGALKAKEQLDKERIFSDTP